MNDFSDAPIPKRRRFLQFSLRSLLLLFLICGLLTGGWLAYVAPYREQARTIARYKELGGSVGLEPAEGPGWQRWLVGDDDFVRIVDVNLKETLANDEDLKLLAPLSHLRELRLWGTDITDDGLKHLRAHTDLVFLSLVDTRVTNEGLRHLSGMINLERLYLRRTDVSDAGLAHLSTLTNLGHLSLVHTQVAGDGLVHLGKMAKLERLYLRDTGLGDQGLAHVMDFAQLKHVSLARTAVTEGAIKTLRESNSQLEISLD
jgi:hypothetical protein